MKFKILISSVRTFRHTQISWSQRKCNKLEVTWENIVKAVNISYIVKRRVYCVRFNIQGYSKWLSGVNKLSYTIRLVLQMQPHVISFYGFISRIRFMFLLFPHVSRNWRLLHATNSRNELDYRVDVYRITKGNFKACNKNVECFSIQWKKNIYSYLKCILYDKLLKPRQSFWITLYFI